MCKMDAILKELLSKCFARQGDQSGRVLWLPTEGGMEIEEVAEKSPEKSSGLQLIRRQECQVFTRGELVCARAWVGALKKATDFMLRLYDAFVELDAIVGGDQPVCFNRFPETLWR